MVSAQLIASDSVSCAFRSRSTMTDLSRRRAARSNSSTSPNVLSRSLIVIPDNEADSLSVGVVIIGPRVLAKVQLLTVGN